MWRGLFWLLFGWWLWRWLARPRHRPAPPPSGTKSPPATDPTRLTEQEITDAEYEEIPTPGEDPVSPPGGGDLG